MVDNNPSPWLVYCPACNEYHYRHNVAAQERAEAAYVKHIAEARALPEETLHKVIGALKAGRGYAQKHIGAAFGVRTCVVRAINARPVVSRDVWRSIDPRPMTEEEEQRSGMRGYRPVDERLEVQRDIDALENEIAARGATPARIGELAYLEECRAYIVGDGAAHPAH